MKDLSGNTLRGYEIREQIGAGGFGAVYRAWQAVVEREVAIKVILPLYANHPEFIRRFEAEAHLVARLEHPHIVPLYDYWREPDGAYLVMRWLGGGSLKGHLKSGPLPMADIARILDEIAGALMTAHRHEIIHRDLKPGNILLDEEGNAYLADFGIAKDITTTSLTTPGAVIGSPTYLAPEQWQGQTPSPQTDIYSLGIMLYELITGANPYPNATPAELLHKHLYEPLPVIPSVPDAINQVIQIATAKQPADRQTDVRSLAQAFRQGLGKDRSAYMPETDGAATALASTLLPDVPTALLNVDTAELRNPYKGLRAFQEADAQDFYGRDALINQLVTRLNDVDNAARFLAVVGPSGSGKSSVVRAGLVPALRRGALPQSNQAFIVEMFPGTHPFEELEAALLRIAVNPPESLLNQLSESDRGLLRAVNRILPGDGTELILVIDQFEEVFTLVEDDERLALFLDSLSAASLDTRSRLRIIITLRADFYDRPLLYPGFGELIRTRTEIVMPLSPAEIEMAIARPADQAGVTLEPGLISAIVTDVSQQPGALPLLQYALTELFERRDGHKLTLGGYQSLGGVAGALARRADELYKQQDDAGQEAIRQLFLRLVTPGESMEDTRRRVRREELAQDASTDQALERYGAYRLLTFDRDPATRSPTVEVAHETLIQSWTRFKDWINESREDLLIHRRLAFATHEWIEAGRASDFLARGAQLSRFEGWSLESNLRLNEEEQAFLDASIRIRQDMIQQEEARRVHELELEHRAANRLRYLVVSLAGGLAVALGLLIFAFDQQQEAQDQADHAQTQAVLAENSEATSVAEGNRANLAADMSRSRELAVQALTALRENEIDLALLLSIEALRTEDTYEAQSSLLTALTTSPRLLTILHGHTDQVRSVAFDPSGQFLASGGADQRVILWDAAEGKPVNASFTGHQGFVNRIAFSPDGTRLASAGADQTIIVWDTATGDRIGAPFVGHEDEVWAITFSPDGRILASAGEDGVIILWDVASGEQIASPLESQQNLVFDLAFAPDGKTLASGGADNTIRLWDMESYQPVGEPLTGHRNWVLSVAFAPDGKMLASGGADNTIRLWDVESLQSIGDPLTRHTNWVRSLAFSPDGAYLASGGIDNWVYLWDADSAESVDSWYTGHQDGVWSVAFSPDGHELATGGADGTVRVWAMTSHSWVSWQSSKHPGQVCDVAFDEDQHSLISASSDGTVTTATDRGATLTNTSQANVQDVVSIAIDPSGRTVAFGSIDGLVTLWDAVTRQIKDQYKIDPDGIIFALEFSPDGTVLASGDDVGIVNLWNVQTQQFVSEPFGAQAGTIQALAFSAGGDILAAGDQNNTIILWDVTTAQPIGDPLTLHNDRVLSLAFSSDDRFFASGDRMGQIIVWDTTTRQALMRLQSPGDEVLSLAFSPDNRRLASGGRNRTITLWDIASRAILGQPLAGHDGWVLSLAFSADGQTLASGDRSGTVIVWDVDIESWVEKACRIANRNFTETEWQRFFRSEPYRETCSSAR